MNRLEIEQKIRELPEHLIPEITDYLDFLLSKYGRSIKESGAFTFSWEGGLADLSHQYSSVDLQHKAMDWRL